MLICIGSEGYTLENKVAKRFGHAEYLIVFNTETKSFEAYENNNEGHNHDNLNGYLEKGVKTYIVGNIGPNAFDILKEGNSKIFLARKMTVAESIKSFANGQLEELSEPTAKKSIGHGRHEHDD